MAGGLHLWRPRHLAELQRSHLGHSGGGVFNKQDYSVHCVPECGTLVGRSRWAWEGDRGVENGPMGHFLHMITLEWGTIDCSSAPHHRGHLLGKRRPLRCSEATPQKGLRRWLQRVN